MEYKSGDVSKMLNVSPDLIRYYERVGAVDPTKDQYTGYRYFDTWDIAVLMPCMWYKDYGLTMREMSQTLSSEGISVLREKVDQRVEEMEEEIRRQQLLIRRLNQRRKALHDVAERLDKFDIVTSPDAFRYINRHGRVFDSDKEVIEETSRLMQFNAFSNFCFDTSEQIIRMGGESYAWGMAWDTIYAEAFHIDKIPRIKKMNPVKSVHSFFRAEGKAAFMPSLLYPMVQYADQHNLKIVGNAYGHLICNAKHNDMICGFFEAWLPVE